MEETVINTNSTVNKSQEITVNIRINSSQKTCPVLIKENATLRDLLLKAGFGVSAKFFINSKGYLDLEYLNKIYNILMNYKSISVEEKEVLQKEFHDINDVYNSA